LELPENFKTLVKELGNAINDSLSESESVGEVMGRIREAGYDLFLILEVTIGFNKRSQNDLAPQQKPAARSASDSSLRLTNQDAQFLRALKISIQQPDE
jgi:hypothetical protein